jgi:uncharacterized protein YodC (DUF2158 family)
MTVFKPGDLVVLKSGGPVMTIDTVNTDIFDDNKITGILCAWFVGIKLERARFDHNAIVAAPQKEASGELSESQSIEAAGDYKSVLNEMVAAMNDAAEAAGDASRAPARSKRASAAKAAASAAASASGGVN